MFAFASIIILISLVNVAAVDYKEPPPTFEAATYTSWNNETINDSSKAKIYVPFTAEDGSNDMVSVLRLDLVGTDYERGYAHGYLLAKEIEIFQGPALTKYFADEVLGLDISGFPEPLQAILRVLQIKGAIAAPEIFREACSWVWKQEESFVPQYIIDEFNGIGAGMCDSLKTTDCDPVVWTENVKILNMLPELIRMACTAYGVS